MGVVRCVTHELRVASSEEKAEGCASRDIGSRVWRKSAALAPAREKAASHAPRRAFPVRTFVGRAFDES